MGTWKIILWGLLLISLAGQSQRKKNNYLLTGGLALLAGASDGLNQALQFRYAGFKRVFPKANDQFWNPAISWKNKYQNGDPAQGEKFPLSKSVLVFTTDGYHLTRFISNLSTAAAFTVKICWSEKKKWYVYILEGVGYWIVNRAGFALVYNRF